MLELKKRYVRFSPKDDQSFIKIETEKELKYHQDLEKAGYRYEETAQ